VKKNVTPGKRKCQIIPAKGKKFLRQSGWQEQEGIGHGCGKGGKEKEGERFPRELHEVRVGRMMRPWNYHTYRSRWRSEEETCGKKNDGSKV